MNKRPLIIFGTGEIAELAHFYFTTDSEFTVVAFTIDRNFLKEHEFIGLPVIPFDEIFKTLPPHDYDLFIAISYSQINAIRKEKYYAVKAMGYCLASYISSRACCLTTEPIGDNCFILEDNTIQPFVRIGNNVTLWSGNHIGHHSILQDHTFLASHIVVSGGVEIGEQCFVGVNATLRDHIRIGKRCVIGAGALLLTDAEDDGVYVGNASERSRIPSSRIRKI
jgi:sugar O-acyltransferase (sialic acid O-acetyltransferase NeuD family)